MSFVQPVQRALWMPSLLLVFWRPFSQQLFWRLVFWLRFSWQRPFWLVLLLARLLSWRLAF
jgi:hypothetical protein